MKKKFIFLLFIFFTGFAHAQKDTLFFKNGSVVIGEIIKVQLGVITFDPDDANDITVQLRKLASINGTSRDFRIETTDRQVFIGILIHHPNYGYVNVVLGTDTTAVFLSDISNLYPVARSFRKRIEGYASAGYSYTKSSDLGRLNFDGSARYQNQKSEFSILYNSISTVEEGDLSRDNENANARYNYLFHPRWYAGGLLNYQRNIELGIRRRYQEGLGLGNKLITSKYMRLMVFSGMVVNQETSTEGEYSGNLTEVIGGIRFNVFRFEKPELNIETIQNIYLGLMQDRYRYDGNISLRWEIVEDFDLNLSFYSNYDSKPPGETAKKIDYGTVIGLAFEF